MISIHMSIQYIPTNELEIKDTTESSMSASYLDILLNIDINGKLTTQLYDKRDDFSFSIVNFPYLCSNIPSSPAYGVYVSQLIRYARACSAYDQFLNRGKLLTDKLLLQGFQQSRLKAAFRKFYGRYNNLVYQYDLSLSQMLSDVFHSHCWAVFHTLIWLRIVPFTWSRLWAHGGCDRSTGDAYSS